MSQETLDHFLARANKIPLLTPSEELILARKVQAYQQLLEAKPDAQYTKAEKAVVVRGKRAMDRFITANLRLVAHLALKYQRSIITAHALEIADLMQEGMLGLKRAVEKFDPERGYKFSTYAYWWIRQAIFRAIQMQSRAIRLPVHVAEKMSAVTRQKGELHRKLGRAPTIAELADAVNWTPADLEHALPFHNGQSSIDIARNDDGTGLMLETLSNGEGQEEQLEAVEQQLRSEQLQEMLGHLPEQQRLAMVWRYGLMGEQQTLQQIGDRLGCSRENVRQLLDRGMNRMRRLMAEREPVYREWKLRREVA